MDNEPVIIVGAGIVGLTLGQALKKSGIPFRIFERDATPTARGQGWAITLHFALDYLTALADEKVLQEIQAAQVDPENALNDQGNFLFLDLSDCSVKFKIPPNKRWRVNREKMRQALLHGIEDCVEWGKRVASVERASSGIVRATFEDGTSYGGRMLVGADGSNSTIRRYLAPSTHQNNQLPYRFTGVAVDMTPDQAKPLRELDPLLFQGLHPPTRTFMWFSTLETPAVNKSKGCASERYRVQLNMSWPIETPNDEVADTNEGRLAFMKARARDFHPKLGRAFESIPGGTEVMEIKLADWECMDWDSRGGLVTLAGDAAHAMTMYRGEAANHGLLDAFYLSKAIEGIYGGAVEQPVEIDRYESEMRGRTRLAVAMSRQACVDAHTWENLNENCAILSRRAIVAA